MAFLLCYISELDSCYQTFLILAAAVSAFMIGCDQTALDANNASDQSTVLAFDSSNRSVGLKIVDAAMKGRIATAKQLARQANRKRETPNKRVIRYVQKDNKVLRFKSRKNFQEAATAIEVFADLKGRPIEIASSLSGYLDREEKIYLLPSELALFSPEGKVIVKGVLFEIKADFLVATILATRQTVQYPLTMDAYLESTSDSDQDPVRTLLSSDGGGVGTLETPPPCDPESIECDDGGSGSGGGSGDGGGGGDPPAPNPTIMHSNIIYSVWSAREGQYFDVRATGKNYAHNTGPPAFRNWAHAYTYIKIRYNGQWIEPPGSDFFSSMYVEALLINHSIQWFFDCDEYKLWGSDDDADLSVDQDRCRTGVSSKHYASVNQQQFYWPTGGSIVYLD